MTLVCFIVLGKTNELKRVTIVSQPTLGRQLVIVTNAKNERAAYAFKLNRTA